MNHPKFTIAIPAYKATYLQECIDSILSQTCTDFELVIVNDASPEDLDTIVYSNTDSRIRYYKNESNCGSINVVNNWNKCLEYATGDYIICMGDDDRLKDNCLDEYLKLINKYPGLGVYHAWTEIIDENSNFLSYQQPRPEFEGCMSLAYNRWIGRSQYIGDFCFETQQLRADGGFFFLPMAWASDDISAIKAAKTFGVANTQVPCFQYRVNRQTISNSGNLDIKLKAVQQERKWYENFFVEIEPLIANEVEKKYHSLLIRDFDRYFLSKIRPGVTDDIILKPIKIFYWLKHYKDYGLTKNHLLTSIILAIGNIFRITNRKY